MHSHAQIINRIILVIIGFIVSFSASAQREQWFTPDDNLSSSLINKIFYDSRGMIWVVTEYGLNRYDGTKFTVYHNIAGDSTSIASNFINNIFEDSSHRVFVCSHNGLQIYNRATNRFTPALKVKTGQTAGSMSDVVERSSGELWAFGDKVYRIIGTGYDVCLEEVELAEDMAFSHRAITDKDDNIWVTRGVDGICRIGASDNAITHYDGIEGKPMFNTLMYSPDGCLYAGSDNKGLYIYDSLKDAFVHPCDGAEDLPICVIYPDADGRLFVGTDGNGLKRFNIADENVSTLRIPSRDSGKLKIHALTRDDYGNLWIGIYQKGMVKLPPKSRFFKEMGPNSIDYNLIGNCCVTAIYRNGEGTIYVGTDNDGIYAVDKNEGVSRHFSDGLPNSIITIFEDTFGNLWVGSYDKGAGHLDKKTGKYTRIPINDKGVPVNHIYEFQQLSDGSMVIATMGHGLYKYDYTTKTASRIELPGLGNWITTVDVSARDGKIFAGSYDGLFVVSPDFKTVNRVGERMIVNAIHEEPTYGHIWLGTSEGLVQVDSTMNITRIYTMADGLPSLSIYAIERADDALWLSSNRGLTKFFPATGQLMNFTVDNGLPSNEFSKNSSFRDQCGNIYFGGINGIVFFKADVKQVDVPKLTLRITDFLIGDRSINAGDRSGGRVITSEPVTDTKVFRLGADDNSFSVRFSAREFIDVSQALFYYSLDNGEWTLIPYTTDRYGGVAINFTGMKSGQHKLQMKAINAGVESDTLTVDIDIATVWWATWWAKIIYGLIVIAIVYAVYRQKRERYMQMRREEERRHKAEILESKLQFFTNISHEIRTPLSLVISPLQKLLSKEDNPEKATAYRTIMRNANRILRLVNELMDLRKIDNRQMRLRFTHVNLTDFVADLYAMFSQEATLRNISLTYTHDGCDDLEAWVDKSNFDKVIMNLLSNAMKFTPEGGQVKIELSQGEDITAAGPLAAFAQISVTDTGIGISEEDSKKIFNRFFQGSNNNAGGTGIGLHLTRQLVELHHGTISAMPNPEGKGTRFEVRIPLGYNHLSPDEMSASSVNEDTQTSAPHDASIPYTMVHDAQPHHKQKRAKSNALVYIVEDDEEIRSYLLAILGEEYRTEGFSNGLIALEEMHRQCPDLVITDVMMPEMDGITLTKKIKQNINLNHVPVIVLTAKSREEDNIEAMDCGASVFITKPFNIDVLVRTVHNQIEGVQRLRNALTGSQSQTDKIDNIKVSSADEKLMDRVMKVINKHLSDSDITVEMIAQEVGISRVHLHRKLKELTNQSTRDFVRNVRLQAAAKLLKEKKMSVSEVADLVGFKQANNFSTCFKDMYGMSPSVYAESHTK